MQNVPQQNTRRRKDHAEETSVPVNTSLPLQILSIMGMIGNYH